MGEGRYVGGDGGKNEGKVKTEKIFSSEVV